MRTKGNKSRLDNRREAYSYCYDEVNTLIHVLRTVTVAEFLLVGEREDKNYDYSNSLLIVKNILKSISDKSIFVVAKLEGEVVWNAITDCAEKIDDELQNAISLLTLYTKARDFDINDSEKEMSLEFLDNDLGQAVVSIIETARFVISKLNNITSKLLDSSISIAANAIKEDEAILV